MTTSAVCESLEVRHHLAASIGLDPNYLLSISDIRDALGDEVSVYQAEPAAKGRTYLLAERLKRTAAGGKLAGYLALVAVGPDGKPDPAFSGDGIAVTGRRLSRAGSSLLPGILRVDDGGRIYFADATRVLRFTPDGRTDRTFGTQGAITYATPDRPTQLCDMVVTDNGVLVATFSARRNRQHFAVEKIDAQAAVQTWAAVHDSGVAYDVDGKNVLVNSNTAQFARSRGRVVLARVENDGRAYPIVDIVGVPPGQTAIGPHRQNVVVTRFDAAGRGTDVIRRELKQSGRKAYDGQPQATVLGSSNGATSRAIGGNVRLGGNGRIVLVQTDRELLRFDLKARTAKRSPLPGPDGPRPANKPGIPPSYQLFSDGSIGSFDQAFDRNQRAVTHLYRYRADGTLDTAFGDNGRIVLGRQDFTGGADNVVDQIFLDSDGRLNLIATERYIGTQLNLTLRRIG